MTIGNEIYRHPLLDDHEVECVLTIRWFRRRYGYSPLYEEIAEQTGMTKSQVKYAMASLDSLGYIVYGRNRGRGYVLTVKGESLELPESTRGKKHSKYDDIFLTDVEFATMQGINELIGAYHVPPTYSEIMEHMKANSTAAVAYTIKCLREKGYLHDQTHVAKERKVILPTERGAKLGVRLWASYERA